MEMSANPVDVAVYVGMAIGSMFVVTKLLNGFANAASNILSGGSASAGAGAGTASLGSTLLTTVLTASGVVGGAVAGHTVTTEILGIDPPPIIEEYLGAPLLENDDCTWAEEIDKKWEIADISLTFDIETGERQDRPFLVGGQMRFRNNNKFELESDALSFSGTWYCIEDNLLKLHIDLDADEIKEQFAQGIDIPDNVPLDVGLIAIYSVNYQEDVYDFDEILILHLRSAGINQAIIDLIDNHNNATNAIPEQLSDVDISSCDITDIGCWDQVVAQIMAYYAYEIELVRD
jgi:hypothetical protein